MSNLVPVRRTDRTGRTQVRWVREDASPGPASGRRTVSKPFVYSSKAAEREFAAMLVERGMNRGPATLVGKALGHYSEPVRIAAANALDLTYNIAGVALLVHAVRGEDEGYLNLVCEANDFCADLFQSVYDLRTTGPSAERHDFPDLCRTARWSYIDMCNRHGFERDQMGALEGDGLQEAAVLFKASLLLDWTGAKAVDPMPADIEAEVESVRREMAIIEPAAGVIALVHEGLLDWSKDHGETVGRASFGADVALGVASVAKPGCGRAFYALARDRGAFEPVIAASVIAAESPAIADGIL